MLKLGSSESGLSGDAVGRLDVVLTESDDEIEFSYEGFVEEEKLEKLMQELYKEITSPYYNTSSQQPMVTLPSPSSSSSSPFHLSTLPFFSACDVKSDSCGASMSHSSSTVMAGIAFVGPDLKVGLPEKEKISPEKELCVMEMEFDDTNKSTNKLVGEEETEGCDENDDWLARVLGWGPLELENWS